MLIKKDYWNYFICKSTFKNVEQKTQKYFINQLLKKVEQKTKNII